MSDVALDGDDTTDADFMNVADDYERVTRPVLRVDDNVCKVKWDYDDIGREDPTFKDETCAKDRRDGKENDDFGSEEDKVKRMS